MSLHTFLKLTHLVSLVTYCSTMASLRAGLDKSLVPGHHGAYRFCPKALHFPMYCFLFMSDSTFLKPHINNDLSQNYSPPAQNNLNTKIFIQDIYYGKQLVNISFVMPLHDVKYGLHTD
jgi:hypothetical protein